MPWHRYFVYVFETALRDECQYPGYQPYWDWPKYSSNISSNPMFDGSEFSLGGNGAFVQEAFVNVSVPGVPDPYWIPSAPGTGGGCLADGPCGNYTVTLGPVCPRGRRNMTGYEFNPRCLIRDFQQVLSTEFLSAANVNALLNTTTMGGFRALLDKSCHMAGHASTGGDLSDIFSSPNDPAFFFHHAQIDRVWAMWQSADPANRTYAVSDTRTYANSKFFRVLRLKYDLIS